MAAREATKMGLGLSIVFITIATCSTGATGVARVNRHDQYTSLCCFIANKRAQLSKGPTRAKTTLRASTTIVRARANMGQFFKRQCLTLRLRFLDQLFADLVIHVFLKSAFFASKLAQTPTSASRVGFLHPLPLAKPAFTNPLNLLATEGLAITISCQIDDTQINPQEAGWLVWIGIGFGLGNVQEELVITLHQFRI